MLNDLKELSMLIVNETPIAMLTVGQLKEIIASAMPKQEEQPKPEATPTYIYMGWQELGKCSEYHTQPHKSLKIPYLPLR